MKTLVTGPELLEEIKSKKELTSDYQLANYMNERFGKRWSRAVVSKLKNQTEACTDARALDIADTLELDPVYVIAALKAGKEKDERVKKMWENAAKKMAPALLLISAVEPLASCILC